MRLIDADSLIKAIEDGRCANCPEAKLQRCGACQWDDAIAMIEEAPTVDRKPLQPSWLRGKPYCSACGRHLPKIGKEKQGPYFCPWCGRAVKWDA